MKKCTLIAVSAIVACCVVGQAKAEIVPIGEFVGEKSEGFESQTPFQFLPSYDVFGGQGVVQQLGAGQGLHITTGWGFFSTVFPHSGDFFMGGAGVNAEWVFDTPALRFGGFFATNADVAGAVALFYDEAGALIGESDVVAPLGDNWAWNGWETTTLGPGIKSVQIIANNGFNGFIMHDDMQYTAIPAPGALALLALGAVGIRRKRKRAA